MNQHDGEGICQYLSRLNRVTSRCEFTADCTCNQKVSYADHITKYKLLSGLLDGEIKEDALGLEGKMLEETVKAMEVKESTKRATISLGGAKTGKVSLVTPPKKKQCKWSGNKGWH